MNKITPFLTFDGKAEEAARFYVSIFPNSKIDRVVYSPMETQGGSSGTVLIVEYTLAGTPYIALNTPKFTFTEAISLSSPVRIKLKQTDSGKR
jgi:predicted 3-demethylubiquinone-9 3-methyltransferase (glyoxalase superfamily)